MCIRDRYNRNGLQPNHDGYRFVQKSDCGRRSKLKFPPSTPKISSDETGLVFVVKRMDALLILSHALPIQTHLLAAIASRLESIASRLEAIARFINKLAIAGNTLEGKQARQHEP